MKKSVFSNLTLVFSSNLTKLEQSFINYLIDTESKKIKTHHKISNLEKIFSLDLEKLIKLLNKVQKKYIIFNQNGRELHLSLINYFETDNNYIKVDLSEKLKECIEKNSFDIKTAFLLNNINSLKFYYDFCYGINTVREVDFSIEELKEYFHNESYNRFYDFERFVLKELFNNINNNSSFNISYDKIKSGENKNNKIVGIKITITSNFYSEYALKIFELLAKYPYFKDKEKAFTMIFETLKYQKLDLVEEVLEQIKAKGFIEEIFNSELENLSNEDTNFILVKSLEGNFSNILKLQSFLFQEIKKIEEISDLYDEFVTNSFLKRLYLLGTRENFIFKVKNIKLIIFYDKNETSKIEIYEKTILSTNIKTK